MFELHAEGVQIYVCRRNGQGFAWVLDAPEAVLFDTDGKLAGKHFKGPTWTLNDGSSVTGEVSAKQPSPKPGLHCLVAAQGHHASRHWKARRRGFYTQNRYQRRRRTCEWL